MAVITEFRKGTFQTDVLDAAMPVLVYFTGVNCQPCKMVTPVIEALADEWAGKVKIGKMDINRNMVTALKYGVLKAPTLVLFKAGHEVERVMGVIAKQTLMQRLEPYLG